MMEKRGTPDAPLPPGALTTRPIRADQAIEYLRQHPDFLIQHPELLSVLTPPAAQGGSNIVDMQQFILQRLRHELVQLKSQQHALITHSRTNLLAQTRIHAAALALIGARSFEHLIHTVTSELAMMLDIDVVTLCVESESGEPARAPHQGVQILAPGTVAELFGPERHALLTERLRGDPAIFGSGAGLVRSQALLRLSIGASAPAGLIALGSRKPTRFRQAQGTELLSFLAQCLEITIAQWLMLES